MLVVAASLVVGLLVGAAAALLVLRTWSRSTLADASRRRDELLAETDRQVEARQREAQIEARERELKLRQELERELGERRKQIVAIEERVLAREAEVEAKLDELTRREQGVSDREVHTRQLQEELKEAKARELAELERIAGMTAREAKQHVLERTEDLVRHELSRRVRQLEEEARAEAKRRARNLVADAL